MLAWIYRRRFPLASYGWFVFLILLAPTSSFVPIRDPMAERRMYLPFIGLLFITVEFRAPLEDQPEHLIATLGLVVLAVEGALTYQRNQLWGSAVDIWKDTVAKSPQETAPAISTGLCCITRRGTAAKSVREFAKAAQLEPPKFDLLLDWALAYDCAGNSDSRPSRN